MDWATNMTNRGNAKLERGILENGIHAIRGAVADYEDALAIHTPTRFPAGSYGRAAIWRLRNVTLQTVSTI